MAKEVSMIVSWNGRLVAEDEVRVSPFDGGLLRGEGVFETMRATGGRACHWARHYARLLTSAQKLSLEVPDPLILGKMIEEVLGANDLASSEARVRLTLSQNILVTAVPLEKPRGECRVGTSGNPINERSPLVGAKVCSYAENMTILRASGLAEVIRPNTKGELCEGCISNVFFVMGDKVCTPALGTGCLPGVSRAILLEQEAKVDEGIWPVDVLEGADEIWLSSSTRLLTWVDQLDGRAMGGPSARFQRALAGLEEAASH